MRYTKTERGVQCVTLKQRERGTMRYTKTERGVQCVTLKQREGYNALH